MPSLGEQAFKFHNEYTLPKLLEAASKEEGVESVNSELQGSLADITSSYMDALKEKTKAQVVQKITSNPDNLKSELEDTMTKVQAEVTRIVETESTIARNMGADDAIQRLSGLTGEIDPTVYFLVLKDGKACDECVRLHLMPDGITPRVWKRSEVSSGYHKKGSDAPSIGGLHPHCRCLLHGLQTGFGFGKAGNVVWKGEDHDEYKAQRE